MAWPGTPLRTGAAARVGLAAVAMVVVAEVAVWLLRPGQHPIDPVPVSEADYFDQAQLERARDYRSGQRWLALAAIGAEGLVLVVLAVGRPAPARRALERLARRPPLGAAAAVAAIAVVGTWVAPVVLGPIFNRFDALPDDSKLRAQVLALAERAGVDIGEVYRVDASRRGTTLNAYVDGLGPTKRVVLYDNLIDRAERPELRSVVAHELGHVAHDDIPRGIAYVALVAPLGLLFVREVSSALVRRTGAPPGTPAALPAYALSLSIAVFVLNVPGNQLSRQVEASADSFALELTADPEALIDLQQRLAATNLSDPDPPEPFKFLFGTHPPTIERIGAALAYEQGER